METLTVIAVLSLILFEGLTEKEFHNLIIRGGLIAFIGLGCIDYGNKEIYDTSIVFNKQKLIEHNLLQHNPKTGELEPAGKLKEIMEEIKWKNLLQW